MRFHRRHSIVVTVALPCAEPWEQMTPTARGRHCAACAQEVVDFTRKTDAELLAWFQQSGHHAACGRFRLDQLDRPLLPPPAPAPRWRGWLAALLALWTWRTAAPAAAIGQQRPTQHLQPRPVSLSLPNSTLRGQVLDQRSGLPLPNVEVQLDGTDLVAQTDTNGSFALLLPAPQAPTGRPWLLSFRLPDYELRQVLALEATERPVHLSHLAPATPRVLVRGGFGLQATQRAGAPQPTRRR